MFLFCHCLVTSQLGERWERAMFWLISMSTHVAGRQHSAFFISVSMLPNSSSCKLGLTEHAPWRRSRRSRSQKAALLLLLLLSHWMTSCTKQLDSFKPSGGCVIADNAQHQPPQKSDQSSCLDCRQSRQGLAAAAWLGLKSSEGTKVGYCGKRTKVLLAYYNVSKIFTLLLWKSSAFKKKKKKHFGCFLKSDKCDVMESGLTFWLRARRGKEICRSRILSFQVSDCFLLAIYKMFPSVSQV